jgi:hypothetical protein
LLSNTRLRRLLPALFVAAVLGAILVATGSAASTPPPNLAALVSSGEISKVDPSAADAAPAPTNPAAAAKIDPSHAGTIDDNGHGNGGSIGRSGGSSIGFAGLTMQDQRLADGGNQFSLEPPDQGMCTSGIETVEAVNDVFQVYGRNGQTFGSPQALTPFFTGQHQIDRSNAPVYKYGPFLSDPKCYWDPDTGRFFMTILEIDVNPVTDNYTGNSHVYIAVSKTPIATTNRNDWYFYSIDTTDAGPTAADPGVPNHADCPCFGDQPLLGADQYGFYITTNEFPLFANGFNGSQVYALDKHGLANGQFRLQRLVVNSAPFGAGNLAYSLQPATSPTPFDWDHSNNGTEYLLSALDFVGLGDTRVAAWSITNSKSLTTPVPAAVLSPPTLVTSEPYVSPPPANQKAGPYPLGTALGDPEEQLNTNDDRMNQVVYAHGNMWAGVNTSVVTDGNPADVHAGIAYFVVQPKSVGPVVTASMTSQGYVTLPKDDTFFPSIGVNVFGQAVMTFSYSGPDYYPSVGYTKIDIKHGPGPIEPVAVGQKPDDGFTGYPQYTGGSVGRWGDYSAAVSDLTGTIWIAAEWIPGTFGYVPGAATPPSFVANWGTYIARVQP